MFTITYINTDYHGHGCFRISKVTQRKLNNSFFKHFHPKSGKMASRIAVFSAGIIFAANLVLAASSPSPIQVHTGFEYLGTADGKVFVRPILADKGSDDLTYQDAIAKCNSAGYRIATLESQSQNDVVEPFTSGEYGYRWSWIDGVDFQIPDAFFSINTGKNLTYFNWTKWGQRPIIGKDDNNCIRISCNSSECGWWDVQCTDKYSVICET